jgi:hypothetical protein
MSAFGRSMTILYEPVYTILLRIYDRPYMETPCGQGQLLYRVLYTMADDSQPFQLLREACELQQQQIAQLASGQETAAAVQAETMGSWPS